MDKVTTEHLIGNHTSLSNGTTFNDLDPDFNVVIFRHEYLRNDTR